MAVFLDFVEHRGHLVAAAPLRDSLPDPDDEPCLEVALAGAAEHPVTGNLVHFPAPLRQGVAVVLPGEFLAAYRSHR